MVILSLFFMTWCVRNFHSVTKLRATIYLKSCIYIWISINNIYQPLFFFFFFNLIYYLISFYMSLIFLINYNLHMRTWWSPVANVTYLKFQSGLCSKAMGWKGGDRKDKLPLSTLYVCYNPPYIPPSDTTRYLNQTIGPHQIKIY